LILIKNEEFNIMLIFYHGDSKEENYKCFGGKLIQKLEKKP